MAGSTRLRSLVAATGAIEWPQRLHLDPLTGETTSVAPFGVPGGGIIAPPVVVPEQYLSPAWDSINGGLAGVSIGEMETNWTLDIRPSMQPIVFPDSGELVINDFADDGIDYLVVDVETGELLVASTPARGLRTVCSSAPATIVTSTTTAPSRSPGFTGPDRADRPGALCQQPLTAPPVQFDEPGVPQAAGRSLSVSVCQAAQGVVPRPGALAVPADPRRSRRPTQRQV